MRIMSIAQSAPVTWLAIWLLVLDVVAAAEIRPAPGQVLDGLLLDPTQVCSVGGMTAPVEAPARGNDHFQCVFCLPLAHVGSAAPAPAFVLVAPLGASLGRTEADHGAAFVRVAVTIPPARAPPATVRTSS